MAYQHLGGRVVWTAVLGGLLTLGMGLTACNGQARLATPTSAPAPTANLGGQTPSTVRLSVAGAIGEAGQYIAESQGYFAQEGLAVEFVKRNTTTAVAALITGQIDVAGNAFDPGLVSAIQQGVDFRIVATQASSEPNANGVFLVVRKDLIDTKRIQGYADLKGLKIAIPARGNSAEYVVAKAIEAGGHALSDEDVVVLDFPNIVTALGSHAIDMGVLPEPLATVAVQNGSGVKWKGYADIVPGIQQTVIVFSPQFSARREVATRWMTAYIRGIRDYNDAFMKDVHRPQTVEALAGVFSLDPKLFDTMGFTHIDANGKVNVASLQDLMRWYLQTGYVSAPVDLTRVLDPSFAEDAVTKLGVYQ